MVQPEKRIFGIENEYGITCPRIDGRGSALLPEAAAQLLFAPLVEKMHTANVYLPNGSRLYLDVGTHPEYASAECDDPADLLANDRAGDAILRDLAAQANKELRAKQAGQIHLFKNNVDSAGHSFGCHENYLVRRRRDYRARVESLIPFFVSRQLLVGAGYIMPATEDEAAHFEISQRARYISDSISAATTNSRPLINTRDEPHGDPERFRRLHVIVGDSNIGDATTALKICMTEAVLGILETGEKLPEYTLEDPLAALRAISQDWQAVVPLANGKSISALDLQIVFYQWVESHYEKWGWEVQSPLRQYAFQLWKRALTALEADNLSAIATEIDWVAKRRFFRRYQEKFSLDYGDIRLARLELAWHDITEKGLRDSLEERGILRVLLTPAEISAAQLLPPRTTRAKLRGDFIQAAQTARATYLADWSTLQLVDGAGVHSIELDDPFVATDKRVELLLARLEK